MLSGEMIKGDCDNCMNGVDFEYRYTKDGLDTFVCQVCGQYNHRDAILQMEDSKILDWILGHATFMIVIKSNGNEEAIKVAQGITAPRNVLIKKILEDEK